MLALVVKALKLIGITSVVGLLGLYLTFLGFLPEITIEGVSDKSERFSSESRLVIRNIGRLPALSIKAGVDEISAYVNTNSVSGGALTDGPDVASRLASGESTEISITPGMYIEGGARIDEFSYNLTLNYHARLLFYKQSFSKKWRVELRNRPDGYHWEIKII